jgi:hypothetical protein
MRSQYTLAICELFSPTKHGKTINSSPDIETHWIVYTTISLDEFYDGSYNEDIELLRLQDHHHGHRIMLDIIHMDELESGGEVVGILKTRWLKVLQRRWKSICKRRTLLIRQRGSMTSLQRRQYTGKWPRV